jgi:O-phosphoseryl-tRNA(Cys) synthetase
MNDETVQDLKQFIAATVNQQISDVRDDIKALDQKLTVKSDDLSGSIAEALDNTNEATDSQLKDHDSRITQLEQKTA